MVLALSVLLRVLRPRKTHPSQHDYRPTSDTKTDRTEEHDKERKWLAAAHELARRFVEQHERHHAEGQSESKTNKRIAVGALAIAAISAAVSFITLIVVSNQTGAAWQTVRDGEVSIREAKRQTDIAHEALIASTRPRLKITGLASVEAKHNPGYPAIWMSFNPTYTNFGQSPAENIYFTPHIYIIGAGPSPKKACEADKAFNVRLGMTPDLVFPKDVGSQNITSEIPLGELQAALAKLEAERPGIRLDFLGVVGCLTYQSADSPEVYATGFVADIQTARSDGPYISAYEAVTSRTPPFTTNLKVVITGAWSD